jgi:hypothetical protein
MGHIWKRIWGFARLGRGFVFLTISKLMNMKIKTVLLGLVFLAVPFFVSAASHSAGTNIISNGTVYMITADGQRRPYTSAGAFLSYGFNSWTTVGQANTDDLTLPVGNFIPPRDGKIVCSNKGSDKGTCYLITDGQKAAFTSATVFTGLGFNFSDSLSGDVSFLASAPNISNTSQAHPAGTLVNKNGTVYLVGDNGLLGVPDMNTLSSWGYSTSDIVSADRADSATEQSGVMSARTPGALSPLENTSLSLGTNPNTPTSTTPIPTPASTLSNTVVFDACTNIPGVQSTVPAGMTGDGQGNCYVVNNIPSTPVASTPTPIITPTPTPTPTPTSTVPTPTPTPTITTGTVTASPYPNAVYNTNIIKGTTNVQILEFNITSTWPNTVQEQLSEIDIKYTGTSVSNNLTNFKVNGAIVSNPLSKADNTIGLNLGSSMQLQSNVVTPIIITADVPLSAQTNESFQIQLVNPVPSGNIVSSTFTISVPIATQGSATVAAYSDPNYLYTPPNPNCSSQCGYYAILRLSAQNNPISISSIKIHYTSTASVSDVEILLPYGTGCEYTATQQANNTNETNLGSGNCSGGAAYTYTTNNEADFIKNGPSEFFHIDPNQTADLWVLFDTLQGDGQQPVSITLNGTDDIGAFNYQNDIALPVQGSVNAVLQKY